MAKPVHRRPRLHVEAGVDMRAAVCLPARVVRMRSSNRASSCARALPDRSRQTGTRATLAHRTQHQDNTITRSGPKAQGKSIMWLGLTGSLLRNCQTTNFEIL